MSLFRRGEPLHVRLAREGGLLVEEKEPVRPAWDAAGIHGLHRTREWDTVVTLQAPELTGERCAFVTLAPGESVVEEGTTAVGPLAEAVERELQPPYRAEAVRRDGSLWAVAAKRIEIVHLPDATGDELELSLHDGERTLVVDGQRTFGSIPVIERSEHVVRATRIDGDAWEIESAPL